ncbi:hypothetical protein TNCV_4662371 [Trichonephila clavipes]|uniref:Reverse transcriptase domain-containing protein n=1 Tax=Trichonephila clavipes TaxID=2585209 RepID=A0A8X6SB85_TRICX|nr:hypothetical protein TNCV_4662371 [Trichonephila clavipes]
MAKGKALKRKFSDIEKLISGFIMFVDTFDEDDKKVLMVKLSQLEVLNIKFKEVKEEIFTSLTNAEFDKFDAKITTCNEHIQKLKNHDLYNCDKFKNMPVRERSINKIFSEFYEDHGLREREREEYIVSYCLKTVTYGTKSAPYLATRCLLQLAHEGKNKYPLATPVIQNSTYMDDILSEADDITTAKKMQR